MVNKPYIREQKDTKPEYFDIFLRGFSTGFGIGITLVFALYVLFR
jgi:hypothetical protein